MESEILQSTSNDFPMGSITNCRSETISRMWAAKCLFETSRRGLLAAQKRRTPVAGNAGVQKGR